MERIRFNSNDSNESNPFHSISLMLNNFNGIFRFHGVHLILFCSSDTFQPIRWKRRISFDSIEYFIRFHSMIPFNECWKHSIQSNIFDNSIRFNGLFNSPDPSEDGAEVERFHSRRWIKFDACDHSMILFDCHVPFHRSDGHWIPDIRTL